jgi:cytochrome c553
MQAESSFIIPHHGKKGKTTFGRRAGGEPGLTGQYPHDRTGHAGGQGASDHRPQAQRDNLAAPARCHGSQARPIMIPRLPGLANPHMA